MAYHAKNIPFNYLLRAILRPLPFEVEVGEKIECLFIQIFWLQDGSPRRIKNPGAATLGHSGRLAGGPGVGRYRQGRRRPPAGGPLLTYFPRPKPTFIFHL